MLAEVLQRVDGVQGNVIGVVRRVADADSAEHGQRKLHKMTEGLAYIHGW